MAVWIRWCAREGETPGWDIEFSTESGLVAVEVKGTTGKTFSSIELTRGELEAARQKGKLYWLYLVADVLTHYPRIQCINDPAQLLSHGNILAEPILWRLTFASNRL